MSTDSSFSIIPSEIVEKRIILIRGQKVLLDFHLAQLYEVETKALKRAVNRNQKRFPPDFMFELTKEEWENLRYHFGTSSDSKDAGWGGVRYLPYAFTEHGAFMLGNILRSERAIEVSLEIVRAFIKLREFLASHKELAQEFEKMRIETNEKFRVVFDALNQLMKPPEPKKREMGFILKEPLPKYNVKKRQQ